LEVFTNDYSLKPGKTPEFSPRNLGKIPGNFGNPEDSKNPGNLTTFFMETVGTPFLKCSRILRIHANTRVCTCAIPEIYDHINTCLQVVNLH